MASSYTCGAFATTRTSIHRLRRLSGRDSAMATVSPTFASLFSSCATNRDVLRWVLPYTSWRPFRSTATTTVLSILSLTTVPVTCALTLIVFTRRDRRPARLHLCLALAQDRLDLREILANGAHLRRRLELPHRLLDAQPEQMVVELLLARAQLVDAEFPDLPDLHTAFSCAKRVANFVLIGSFAAASCIARRASVSVTPSISNITLPGRTTQTHCSGAPLPLPMRVSCGFFVMGLSGNTRTQILPPRLMKRVIATRAASIWRSVIHAGSIALRP